MKREIIFFTIIMLAWGGIFLLAGAIGAQELININTATLEELDTLPGIGPSKAQAIIDYREQNGPFAAIEDIMNVSGIGQVTYDNIKNLITVGGEDEVISETDQIVINEVLPNPEGSDDFEWIELKNIGETVVNLTGWRLEDKAGKSYTISGDDFMDTVMGIGGFFVLERGITGIALNNSDEELYLYSDDGSLIDTIAYIDSAKDNMSWVRSSLGEYSWTGSLTKGEENIIDSLELEEEGDEPEDDVSGGSSSAGSEEIKSNYKEVVLLSEILPNPKGIDREEWLEIQNTRRETISLQNWKLKDNNGEFIFKDVYLKPNGYLIVDLSKTEIVLNNIGGDYLELIDGLGWLVARVEYKKEVEQGMSYNWCELDKKWIWLEEMTPGEINKCPIPNEEPFAYFESEEEESEVGRYMWLDAGESYDKDGKIDKYIWEFSGQVSVLGEVGNVFEFKYPEIEIKFLEPGKLKVNLKVLDDLGGEAEYNKAIKVGPSFAEATEGEEENCEDCDNKLVLGEEYNYFNWEKIANIREMALDSYVILQGIVLVEPGVMGKTIFYIADDEANGLQVYSYKKDFPGLAVGDLVEVEGFLSEYQGERRIKTATQNDIRFLETTSLPEAVLVQAEDIGEELEGRFVVLQGELTEIKGSAWWLDDQTGEVKIYINQNTGIKKGEIKIGDNLQVRGIVSQWQDEYRVLPRYPEDIKVIGKDLEEADQSQSVINNQPAIINSSSGIFKYLLAGAAAIIIILMVIIIKGKNK